MKTIAFIGTGNMGSALAKAAAKGGEARLLLTNRHPAKAAVLAGQLGGELADNLSAAAQADYLFLGVKPPVLPELLAELAPVLAGRTDRFVLVSMAAGTSIEKVRALAGGEYPVIRIMPNTPAAIGEGMILYTAGPGVREEELAEFLRLMRGAGRFAPLEERLIDAGSAVAGCGPAFADLFIEALADGGVACGLPRPQALEMAAQMCVGAARLILESGEHPGALKDAVCSPGGTTIQGVRTLEKAGFRGAVMEAVIAAFEKNKEL